MRVTLDTGADKSESNDKLNHNIGHTPLQLIAAEAVIDSSLSSSGPLRSHPVSFTRAGQKDGNGDEHPTIRNTKGKACCTRGIFR